MGSFVQEVHAGDKCTHEAIIVENKLIHITQLQSPTLGPANFL